MNPNDNSDQVKPGWLDRLKGMFIFDNLDPAPNPISAPVINESLVSSTPTVPQEVSQPLPIVEQPTPAVDMPAPSQTPQPAASTVPEAPQPFSTTAAPVQTDPVITPTMGTAFGAGIDPKEPFDDISQPQVTVPEPTPVPNTDMTPIVTPTPNETPTEPLPTFTSEPQLLTNTEPESSLPNIPSAGGANTTETPPLVPSAEPALNPAQQPTTQEPQKVESIGIPFDQVKWS